MNALLYRLSRTARVALALCVLVPIPVFAADEEPPPLSPGSLFGPSPSIHSDGATLYRSICQGCHMPNAGGAKGAGAYPPLAANVRLTSRDYPVATVLFGRAAMPAFSDYLTDAQIAEVVNYVRSHFDNHFTDLLTTADVARTRASAKPPGGSP